MISYPAVDAAVAKFEQAGRERLAERRFNRTFCILINADDVAECTDACHVLSGLEVALLPAHLTPRIAHQFHFAKLKVIASYITIFPLAGLP